MADERFYPPFSFAAPPPQYTDYSRSRVVVLPVPYDSTTTGRAGASDGPRAIIDASEDMELHDLALGWEPYRAGIHTLPELAAHTGSAQAMVERIQEVVGELLDGGKFVVTLGGEHTVAVGALRAHAQRIPGLSVLAIDAHADMRQEYLGTAYNHACTLRRLSEHAPLVVVGLRSASLEEAAYIREQGMAFYSPEALRGLASGAQKVAAQLTENVYISIDLDAFDPSQMAAVGTPEPGGLLWDEVTALLAAVTRERHIVGFDVAELAPAYGPRACAQMAAKLTYRLIGLALGRPEEG
ncbi:MAG: agmatinase [Dehalococcoidia bacterium]